MDITALQPSGTSRSRLLSLSDEILTMIVSHAMTFPSVSQHTPDGLIERHLSQTYRLLLRPFRSCRRLYNLARHMFLSANTIHLSLLDLRNDAIRIEQQPQFSQMLCTGNPDPLLAAIINLEIFVDTCRTTSLNPRGLNLVPYADARRDGDARDERMYNDQIMRAWRLGGRSADEEDAFRKLPRMCPRLRHLHVFLVVDRSVQEHLLRTDLAAVSEKEPRLRRVIHHYDFDRRAAREMGRSVRGLPETMYQILETTIDWMSRTPVRLGTMAFGHWRAGEECLDMRDRSSAEIVTVLSTNEHKMLTPSRVLRVTTARVDAETRRETVPVVKKSWGKADDLHVG